MSNPDEQAKQPVKHPTLAEEIAGHNVFKLGRQEGKTVRVGDTRLTWKTRGENTGYQFAVYEMTLDPSTGVPLHKHPYPEFFYVLEGRVDFGRLSAGGVQEWIQAAAGESVTVPSNAPHAFFNHTERPARFLDVSTHYHEIVFDKAGVEVGIDDPLPTQLDPAELARFSEVAAQLQGFWVELGETKPS